MNRRNCARVTVAMVAGAAMLSGCDLVEGPRAPLAGSTIVGDATAEPTEVAKYSEKRTRLKSGLAACNAWRAGYQPRQAAHEAATAFTSSPTVSWATIAPYLQAEYQATDAELASLPATIRAAVSDPDLHAEISTYSAQLSEYIASVKGAQAAGRTGNGMWGSTNTSLAALTSTMNRIVALCNERSDG